MRAAAATAARLAARAVRATPVRSLRIEASFPRAAASVGAPPERPREIGGSRSGGATTAAPRARPAGSRLAGVQAPIPTAAAIHGCSVQL